MLLRFRKAVEEKDEGFTLIELLVVMIIIGILAAIAIPTFLAQRNNGYNTSAKDDLRNLATAIESYAVDNNGNYTAAFTGGSTAAGDALVTNGAKQAELVAGVDFAGSQGVNITSGAAATSTQFCLVGTNTSNPNTDFFTYSKARGGLLPNTYDTAALAQGAC